MYRAISRQIKIKKTWKYWTEMGDDKNIIVMVKLTFY